MNCRFDLADLDRKAGDWASAAAGYEEALAFYRATGIALNSALALQRLGYTAAGAGDQEQARRYYEESLALFTRIGSPSAAEVRAELEQLDAKPRSEPSS